jgi:hypothetical protein
MVQFLSLLSLSQNLLGSSGVKLGKPQTEEFPDNHCFLHEHPIEPLVENADAQDSSTSRSDSL